MFNKTKCKRCGEKINNKFDFCPHCGLPAGSDKEGWGLLGKNDQIPEADSSQNAMFGGFSGKILNKMLINAVKMLEKEMQKEMTPQKTKEIPLKTNFELYINGEKISPENIKITKKIQENKGNKQKIPSFSENNIKKFSELPKHEPETNVRRLANKVVYEIDVPGVSSIDNVSIAKLEKSIEIKAVGKDKAYKKLIPIDLPLRRYKLDKDKLILELGAS